MSAIRDKIKAHPYRPYEDAYRNGSDPRLFDLVISADQRDGFGDLCGSLFRVAAAAFTGCPAVTAASSRTDLVHYDAKRKDVNARIVVNTLIELFGSAVVLRPSGVFEISESRSVTQAEINDLDISPIVSEHYV